ncbi:MAG: endonuclease/exonuclease/phosphatase family protein [Hyphomonadaceae bacterium]
MQALRVAIAAAAALLAALTLAAFLARWADPFELLSHFRFQFAAGAFGLAVFALIVRAKRTAIAGAALAVLNALPIAIVLSASAPAAQPGAQETRAIWANLLGDPRALDHIAALARVHRADVVALTELPPDGARAVRRAFPDFRCFTTFGAQTVFTAFIATRAPCVSTGEAATERADSPVVFAETAAIRIVAAHPRPPLGPGAAEERGAVSMAAARAASAGERPALLLGDFNATPWSPLLSDITRTGLRRARCGAPFASTWRSPDPIFGLPIDHAFVGEGLGVVSCRVGPGIGSDHRPLLIVVAPAS